MSYFDNEDDEDTEDFDGDNEEGEGTHGDGEPCKCGYPHNSEKELNKRMQMLSNGFTNLLLAFNSERDKWRMAGYGAQDALGFPAYTVFLNTETGVTVGFWKSYPMHADEWVVELRSPTRPGRIMRLSAISLEAVTALAPKSLNMTALEDMLDNPERRYWASSKGIAESEGGVYLASGDISLAGCHPGIITCLSPTNLVFAIGKGTTQEVSDQLLFKYQSNYRFFCAHVLTAISQGQPSQKEG